jgi:dimeric dUTPase (all-alpha-NTP-PPase superfamily)
MMQLELHTLYELQRKLDAYIEKEHQLNKAELVDKKILALNVELAELANETRCFKFWSRKTGGDKEKIVEEYVDGLHFILSLGITFEYMIDNLKIGISKVSETDQFNKLYGVIHKFSKDRSLKVYEELFYEYLVLGKLLHIEAEEMVLYYLKKNEVNIIRQENGY